MLNMHRILLGLRAGLDDLVKSKAIPLQAWTVPKGSRSLRLPQISRQSAHQSGKVISPTHRPPFPPENIPGTHFC
jgi:hypothetical protein